MFQCIALHFNSLPIPNLSLISLDGICSFPFQFFRFLLGYLGINPPFSYWRLLPPQAPVWRSTHASLQIVGKLIFSFWLYLFVGRLLYSLWLYANSYFSLWSFVRRLLFSLWLYANLCFSFWAFVGRFLFSFWLYANLDFRM